MSTWVYRYRFRRAGIKRECRFASAHIIRNCLRGKTISRKSTEILNSDAKVNHVRWMNEQEIETRFEELRNELKAQKEQLDALKEDIKILLKHRSIAPRDIMDTAQQIGNAAFDQSDVHRCREFLRKYDLRKGL